MPPFQGPPTMALELLTTAPSTADFIPLAQHQERTPISFTPTKPVLHNHTPDTTLHIPAGDIDASSILSTLRHFDREPGTDLEVLPYIDVWATSTNLLIWNTRKSIGVRIPYQTITVHAQEGEAVFLGLNLSDRANTADEDLVFVQMRIFPPTSPYGYTSALSAQEDENNDEDTAPSQTNGHTFSAPLPSKALFDAISACQELNPDPPEDGDSEAEDAETMDAAPGAGGWITSENMGDFVDENGEFKLPEGFGASEGGLGEGAGIRRAAEDDEGEEGVEGAKWQRTG